MSKIAVVGMAGVFPKAMNTGQFLNNIINKKDCIIEVPNHRWPGSANEFISKQNIPDRAVSNKAGIIEQFDFDPHGFKMDKDLISALDPLHQLVLQAGREAFSQCSHTRESKKRTGVILAAIALPTDASSYICQKILCDKNFNNLLPKDYSSAGVVSLPAAILSRAMGFEAGCFTLDAACASSLFSIKLACEHLHLNKADIMIAGGVSRPDSLYTQIGFTQLQALSPTGRCSAFDKNADGLVVGEGTGIVVLKRLEDAIKSGDVIHAVITGAGVSNDIEGTLVGPASEGQVRAMTQAYEQAHISPDDIQYMECHGSGTPVGDQVELSSIHTLLKSFDCPDKHLSIGSVKSMLGHLLTAAGAAGFIKTILSMNEGFLPPSLNYFEPSSSSPINNSNIRVQTKPGDWKPETGKSKRKAGISAFGFGGINAHLIVEEFKSGSAKHFVKARGEKAIGEKENFREIPCAIIGMETIAKDCYSLEQFKDLVFDKARLLPGLPGSRWRISTSNAVTEKPGFYMDSISTGLGEFHIPPNQMDDIQPQHIVLLKAAKGALEDANINPRPESDAPLRYKTGCAIGIEFDYGATDFHLRWKINNLDESLKDKISNPLTFNRTLGALGGIVASRVAREFKLGGPCFTISAGAASGIKAIETAVHSLSCNETDTFICGCVDLAGDIRQFALNDAAKKTSQKIMPSEGAAAIVLKRLDQAIEDNDKIYGVISGIAGASGGPIPGETIPGETIPGETIPGETIPGETNSEPKKLDSIYAKSLEKALKNSGLSFADIDLFEAACTGRKEDDLAENKVLSRPGQKTFDEKACNDKTCIVSSTTKIIGNTQGASALFSIVKTALSLNQYAQSNIKLSKKACVASITLDGACSHVILEQGPKENQKNQTALLAKDNDLYSSNKAHAKKEYILKINPEQISDKTIDKIQDHIFDKDIFHKQSFIEGNEPLDHQSSTGVKKTSTNKTVQPIIEPVLIDPALISKGTFATSSAHGKFLEFSKNNMQVMEKQFETLTRLAKSVIHNPDEQLIPDPKIPDLKISSLKTPEAKNPDPKTPEAKTHDPKTPDPKTNDSKTHDLKTHNPPKPMLNREQCLEYAIGKAGNVLGKEFEVIDTYPARVRLPDEPLMLVDRIMDIQGEMLSLKSGKIITQHDVKKNAWYLDGGKAPVSISIEAGQADLFLCAWLGIDHVVMGKRKYRLLDARVTFHRTLPEPHETIEYHIEIDRFLKQGDVYLFFFHYKGYINNQLLISMRDGCAGFFTDLEVENSGGIILKDEDFKKQKSPLKISHFVPVDKQSFTDDKIENLRQGNLEAAFGKTFKNIKLGEKLLLPGGRMHLIDRVLAFDPKGGRFALGSIIAEADIHPDDWFLVCHFIDDKVMPGTLMYECCAHALRIFTQRIGWVSEKSNVFYDVVSNNESDLKCRGPVTPETKKARYEIEIKQMGYSPEPYVIADAHMFSDDLRIVLYKNMGLKLMGITKKDLESFWRKK